MLVISPLYFNISCFGVQIFVAAQSKSEEEEQNAAFFSSALHFLSFTVKVRDEGCMLFFWSVWKQLVKYFE